MQIITITKVAEVSMKRVGLCMFFQRVSIEQAARAFEMAHKRKPETVLKYTDPLFGTVSLYLPLSQSSEAAAEHQPV